MKRKLTPRDKKICYTLNHDFNLNMGEIGVIFDVSQSTVSLGIKDAKNQKEKDDITEELNQIRETISLNMTDSNSIDTIQNLRSAIKFTENNGTLHCPIKLKENN